MVRMDDAAMTEFFNGQDPDDYYDQCTTRCSECGMSILKTEAVNPPDYDEPVCVLCWPTVQAREEASAVPEAVDAEETREAAPVPLERWVDLVRAGGVR